MRIEIKTLLLLVLGLVWAAEAGALGVEGAVSLWAPTPTGSLAYEALTAADHFDLAQEAGLARASNGGAWVKVDLPILPDLFFQATPLEFSGSGSKASAFHFGGHTYPANLPIDSRLVLNHYDLGLIFGVPLLETATLKTLNVDFGLVVRRQEFRAEVVQPAIGQSARVDETYYLPMGYLAAQVRLLRKISLEAELRGLSYRGNRYYDLVGRLRLDLPGPLFLAGGWRHQEIELDEDGIEGSVNFSGPFAEVGVGL